MKKNDFIWWQENNRQQHIFDLYRVVKVLNYALSHSGTFYSSCDNLTRQINNKIKFLHQEKRALKLFHLGPI